MLQGMRELAKSWVFKALLTLLILSFGIWGIGDMFRGNPMKRVVASAGDVEISVQALEQRFQADLAQARQQFGAELTAQQARQIGLLDRTLGMMLERALFDQEIKRLGLSVGDEPIMAKVAALPQLRDKDGKFDADIFRRILAKNGMSERGFLEQEKQETARNMLFESLVAGAFSPKLLADNLYRARGQKRILEVVTLKNASIKDIPAPEEKALRDFHEQNEDLFRSPERRSFTVATLSSESIGKEMGVTDEEVLKAYEERTEELTKPETRNLLQVITQDEAKAKAVVEGTKSGKSLEDAAKAQGLKALAIEGIEAKSLPQPLQTAFFSLTEGGLSDAIKSDMGWHIAQVKKIIPSGKASYDEVKKELKETLLNEKIGDSIAQTVNNWDNALGANTPLEEVADSLRLRLVKFENLDASGAPKDGKLTEEVPAKDEILRQVFALGEGESSQILDDRAGHYRVVRLDALTPAQVLPFEEVKDKVVKAWTEGQKTEKAFAEAEAIATAIREGKKATSFTSRAGIEVKLSKPISGLGAWDKDLPETLAPQILRMKKDEVITGRSQDSQFILKLTDVVEADPTQDELDHVKLGDRLDQEIPYEILEGYSAALKQRYPIKINQDVLDLLKKQDNG